MLNNQGIIEIKKEIRLKMQITKETPLNVISELGKECDQCNNCCKYDTGIVLKEDIPQIAASFKLTIEDFKNKYLVKHDRFNKQCFKFKQIKDSKHTKPFGTKPYGKCIMLDEEKGCTIHSIKPLHCRVCSTKSKFGEKLTQWFALNYLVNTNDPESIRQWAVYLQYNMPIQGGKLEELIPDRVKLKKILGYEILK